MCFGVLFGCLLSRSAHAWPLTDSQRTRLQQYIPRTFAKLEARMPVHIVSLGDSVTMMFTPDKNSGNKLLAYPSVFASQLATEFFYPGGVRIVNPSRGQPAKLGVDKGQEILLENLADGGTISLDVFQPLAAKAFLNDPDLIIVNFGINDAARGQSIEVFRRALQGAVDICRQRKTDIIIVGCSLAHISPGPTGWGLTRGYTTVASEVAKDNGVLFVDLGRANARLRGGASLQADPKTAIDQLAERIRGMFSFDPPPKGKEVLHPNVSAHERMGKAFYETLMEGPPPSNYFIDAEAKFVSENMVEVALSLRNESSKVRRGFVGALAMMRFLSPENPYFQFELSPGEEKQFTLNYKRLPLGAPVLGDARFSPADFGDLSLRFSFFVFDEEHADLLDCVTRLQPVAVRFVARRMDEITDNLRIEWQFLNGTEKPIAGKYRIGLGESVSNFAGFELDPLGAKNFEIRFPFHPSPGVVRIKFPLFVDIDVNGVRYSFFRELETVRDIGLGEMIALSPQHPYGTTTSFGSQDLAAGDQGIVLRVDADASALYCTFDFQEIEFRSDPQAYPMTADIFLDARGPQRVRDFGFVHKLQIRSGTEDGSSIVLRPQMGTFGETYNQLLSEAGFVSVLGTNADGKSRRLQVRVPRQYLYRHDWRLGQVDSVLGLNTIVNMTAVKPESGMPHHPEQRGYVLTKPSRGLGATMNQFDPRGFATLRLMPGPLKTWSAWIY